MSNSIERLERMRGDLNAMIEVAAVDAKAAETGAAIAVENAAANAYQRGLAAGQALGRDAMRANVIAIIESLALQLLGSMPSHPTAKARQLSKTLLLAVRNL